MVSDFQAQACPQGINKPRATWTWNCKTNKEVKCCGSANIGTLLGKVLVQSVSTKQSIFGHYFGLILTQNTTNFGPFKGLCHCSSYSFPIYCVRLSCLGLRVFCQHYEPHVAPRRRTVSSLASPSSTYFVTEICVCVCVTVCPCVCYQRVFCVVSRGVLLS